jgi:hypothetical protein
MPGGCATLQMRKAWRSDQQCLLSHSFQQGAQSTVWCTFMVNRSSCANLDLNVLGVACSRASRPIAWPDLVCFSSFARFFASWSFLVSLRHTVSACRLRANRGCRHCAPSRCHAHCALVQGCASFQKQMLCPLCSSVDVPEVAATAS